MVLALFCRLLLVVCKFLHFDWLISPEKFSQPILRLTSRQFRSISSDSVMHSDGRKKLCTPENLYEKVVKYLLYKECSKRIDPYFFGQ